MLTQVPQLIPGILRCLFSKIVGTNRNEYWKLTI